MPSSRSIHLVGSVNLPSAANVFEGVARLAGPTAKRIPDGETGERSNWITWQVATMARTPFWQANYLPEQLGGYKARPRFAIKPGTPSSDLHFGPLGYSKVALESFKIFADLKRKGRIPKEVRLQVSLPTPLALLTGFIEIHDQAALEAPLESALLGEMEEIVRGVPHDELAIQWDVAVEIAILETDLFESFLKDDQTGMITRLARLGVSVPADVEVGYHLCYGGAEGKHFKEPADTRLMVEIAAGILKQVRRRVNWIHLPVPISRDDDAYFAPLRALSLPKGTELYLGLVHHDDGVAGAKRRIAAASRFVQDFGIGTECGMGRGGNAAWAEAMLALHRQVAEELD
jgi:methionine synthase II (cobalamin-independent)